MFFICLFDAILMSFASIIFIKVIKILKVINVIKVIKVIKVNWLDFYLKVDFYDNVAWLYKLPHIITDEPREVFYKMPVFLISFSRFSVQAISNNFRVVIVFKLVCSSRADVICRSRLFVHRSSLGRQKREHHHN